MGLFNFRKTKASPISELDSFNKLCTELFKASHELANSEKIIVSGLWKSNNLTYPEETAMWITMLTEFIHFYLMLTDRIAFPILDNRKRKELMNEIFTIMEISVVDVAYKGDDQKKDRLRKYFSEMYYESSDRYRIGRELLDQKEPITGNGLISILGRSIAEINNSPMNPEIITTTIELTANSLKKIDIKKLIEEFKNT